MIERQNYKRIKKHLVYLEEVLQLSPLSVERYWFFLRHLILWADDTKFQEIPAIRPTFPVYLSSLPGKDGRESLSGESQKKILNASKRFLLWCKAEYPRDMANMSTTWIDTLRMVRQPKPSIENVFVSLDEIRKIISYPADDNDLALIRDQAAAAMLFLSGMRAKAFVTLPTAAIDLDKLAIRQWPELGVQTKNSKKANTFLLNLPELLEPVKRWDKMVRSALPDTASWYTPIAHYWGEQRFSITPPGKNRSTALAKRLKLLFLLVDLEVKSPHKFRHGHAVYGLLHAQTMADYKAVSMNLMHESIEITDSIYAPLVSSDVQDRIHGLTNTTSDKSPTIPDLLIHQENELGKLLATLDKEQISQALVMIAGRLSQ